jgi:spermidine/putrescine transport system ATP-binding protein
LMSAVAHGETGGRCRVQLGDFELFASQGDTNTSGDTKIVIRPERVHLETLDATGENRVPGMVERVVYLGNSNQIIVGLASGEKVQALVQNTGDELAYKQGDPVRVHMPAEALRVLTDTGTAPIDEGAVPHSAAAAAPA